MNASCMLHPLVKLLSKVPKKEKIREPGTANGRDVTNSRGRWPDENVPWARMNNSTRRRNAAQNNLSFEILLSGLMRRGFNFARAAVQNWKFSGMLLMQKVRNKFFPFGYVEKERTSKVTKNSMHPYNTKTSNKQTWKFWRHIQYNWPSQILWKSP